MVVCQYCGTCSCRRCVATFISSMVKVVVWFFFSSRRRHTRFTSDWSSDVCSSDLSRLWRTVATRLGEEYPDVELDHVLVDACAMQLIQGPATYDVIVAENTFGDILSDEASVLAASMGLLPSASLAGVPVAGQRSGGLYEPIHGTAPDIAGKGIANPTGSILSVALMVRYSLGLTEEAAAIELAVDKVLEQGVRTADTVTLGDQQVSTIEMGDRIVAAVENGS